MFKIKRVGPRMQTTNLSLVEITPEGGEVEVRFGYYHMGSWWEILERESTVRLVEVLKARTQYVQYVVSRDMFDECGNYYDLGPSRLDRRTYYKPGEFFQIGCCNVRGDGTKALEKWLDKHTKIVEE